MATYNRGALLGDAVRSVLAQHDSSPSFELIVVNNNSTDDTERILQQFAESDARVRPLFERQQGLSFARNAGIDAARAPLIAFTDDDVRAGADWTSSIVRAFAEFPDADIVGGRVLAMWPETPPAWLTRDHWAPLALVDYGESPIAITPHQPVCLVGANMAFRRTVFEAVGPFATTFQRVKDSLGSLEDHDMLLRLLRTGRTGIYDPRLVIRAEVQANRLDRAYHRRWHSGHGHFHALLRSEEMERSSRGTLFGVPAHLYRQAAGDAAGWVRARLSGDVAAAFRHELRLRFFAGFFRTRNREYMKTPLRQRIAALVSPVIAAARRADTRWHRFRSPLGRDVVFDARTAMEFAMMAPVYHRLRRDPRVRTWLMSSERPGRLAEIYRDAPPDAPRISPRAAAWRRFDACIAADFVWASLPRGTRRIQMFHGVAGKWSQIYDRPVSSMRQWDRFFFINRRRLDNFIASGALARDSAAIRLIGMPKVDCLVDGSLQRDEVLAANGLDPSRQTVLYAPTWTPYSSLNAMGEAVVAGLIDAGYQVLVKLHENSFDSHTFANSGGIDWPARLRPILERGHGHLVRTGDASTWLVASDVLISDHSSIGFEYLLLDRPLIRIDMPELIARANIGQEYVDLIARASTTVTTPGQTVSAVATALADPAPLSSARRRLAAELFHDAGRATDRAVCELYSLMALDAPAAQPAASFPASMSAAEHA